MVLEKVEQSFLFDIFDLKLNLKLKIIEVNLILAILKLLEI